MKSYLYILLFLFASVTLSAQQRPDLCHRWEALAPDSVPQGTAELLPIVSLEFRRDSSHTAQIFPNIERKGFFSYDAVNNKINCRYENNGLATLEIISIQNNVMILSYAYRGKTVEQFFVINDPTPVSAGKTYSENDHLFNLFIPENWEIDDPAASLYMGGKIINPDTSILGLLIRVDTSSMSNEHFIHKTLSALNLDGRNIIKSGPFNTNTVDGKYFLMKDSEADYKLYVFTTKKAKIVLIGFTNAPLKKVENTFDTIALSFTPVKIK